MSSAMTELHAHNCKEVEIQSHKGVSGSQWYAIVISDANGARIEITIWGSDNKLPALRMSQ